MRLDSAKMRSRFEELGARRSLCAAMVSRLIASAISIPFGFFFHCFRSPEYPRTTAVLGRLALFVSSLLSSLNGDTSPPRGLKNLSSLSCLLQLIGIVTTINRLLEIRTKALAGLVDSPGSRRFARYRFGKEGPYSKLKRTARPIGRSQSR